MRRSGPPARLVGLLAGLALALVGAEDWISIPAGYRRLSGLDASVGRTRMRELLAREELCGTLLVAADGAVYREDRACEPHEIVANRPGRSVLEEMTAIPLSDDDAGSNQTCIGCIPGSRVPVNDSLSQPYLPIGRLLGRIQGEAVALECTGTLIGRRHVITAAHCVFDITGNRQFVASITYAQAQNVSAEPYGTVSWSYARIQSAFAMQEDYTLVAMNNDFALVTLSEDAAVPVYYNLSVPLPIGYSINASLTTSGYPQEEPSGSMWQATCNGTIISYSTLNGPLFANVSLCAYDACNNLFRHTCIATTGQSGSAMWTREGLISALLISKVTANNVNFINIGIALTDAVGTTIRNWYEQDGNDARGPLPAPFGLDGELPPPPPPAVPIAKGSSIGAWRAAALALAAVLGAAGLAAAILAALAVARRRRLPAAEAAAADKPVAPPAQDVALTDRVVAPNSRGIVDTHSRLLESGTFAVEDGGVRPFWEEAGVLDYSNGDRFAGELSRRRRPSGYGIGQYARPRGAVFAGQWMRGRPHGWGVVSRAGEGRVAGRWVEGRPVIAMAQGVEGEYSIELEDERAEVLDMCTEAARCAEAAAEAAAASGARHSVHGSLHRATG